MNLKYTISRKDLFFGTITLALLRSTRLYILVICAALIIGILQGFVISLMIGVFAGVVTGLGLLFGVAVVHTRRNYHLIGTREVLIGDKGFQMSSDAFRIEATWSSKRKIASTKSWFVMDIYGMHPLIIPRRILSTEAERSLRTLFNEKRAKSGSRR